MSRGIFTPELLDRCIACGFCLPACPTYVRTGVDLVVAVNPGCLRQLQTGLRRRRSRVRAVHLAELLVELSGAESHDNEESP